MNTENLNEENCCPQFDPKKWDDKIFEWDKKMFIKDSVRTFLHMPLNFGKIMTKMHNQVCAVDAEDPEFLCLSDHLSSWKMDVYLAVNKQIPEAKNVIITGKFFSKVYEGSFNNTGKWMKDFQKLAKIKGLAIQKNYLWYTTCPECAKKYGKNYVVIVGEINEN
jgi:hypothetical protein